jgi:diguanylate cyclase (GGDEF)-like protein
MAERLVSMFQALRHVIGNGKEIVVTTSIGVSVLGVDHEFNSAEKMISAADKALYIAKESGRNRYVIFGSDMEQNIAGASSPAA